jgi:hypothetical protein
VSNPEDAADGAPLPVDPWKGFRGICAATLILEVIVVLLALPVISHLGGGLGWGSGVYITVLTLGLFVGAGLQRRSWAMKYNLTLQVLMVAGFVFHFSLGVMGIVFCLVWGFILRARAIVAERYAAGTLSSQQP